MPNENEIEKLDPQNKATAEPKVEPVKEQPQAEPKKEEAKKEEPVKEQPKVEPQAEPKAEEKKPDGRSIEDYVLKADLENMFKPFGEKIDALIKKDEKLAADNKALEEAKANLEKEKAELEAKQKEIEAQLNGLKDKYENNAFGNANNKGMVNPTEKANHYVTFEEMSKPWMK